MPHSNPDGSPGYHGTIAVNPGTTLAVNPGSALNIGGGQQIVGGQSVLTNQGVQNNQDNVPTFEEVKQLEEKIKNQMSGIDAPGSGVDGFEGEPIDRREAYIAAQADAGILGNLMKKQQEDSLRKIMLTDAKLYDFLAKENLLGYKGGLFGLDTGKKIGGTIYPDFAYQYVDSDVEPSEFKSGMSDLKTAFDQINPITGERIRTVKAREGLTTPQYNQFISDLYDANPELYQETFPFASGQIAKPIFAKVAEGIMGIPGASELAQMGGDVVGAMIDPLSGFFTGKTKKTPKIKYDNQGNIIDIISQTPDGGGTKEGFKPSDRKLPYIHSGEIPAEYLDGFAKFYQNYEGPIVGGAMITPVTLPDGSVIEFGDTGSARVFREYLESIGATQPEKPSGIDAIQVIPTPLKPVGVAGLGNYPSYFPFLYNNTYTNRGLPSAYSNILSKYYGFA